MAGSVNERARIESLIERDGQEAARAWARRTEALYRSAVLDHRHYAHTPEYRRSFIESYLQLKCFAMRGSLNAAVAQSSRGRPAAR